MSVEEYQQIQEQEKKDQLDAQNLGEPAREDHDSNTAEILRYLSQVDDLPIGKDDPVMGQLISTLTSTSNLSAEQVKSNEWVFQYILVLYLSQFPDEDGMHGTDRCWSHNDASEYRDPMKASRRTQIEAHVTMASMALTRSEDMAVPKESMRTVKESIVNNDEKRGGGSSGILGRLGIR